MHQQHVAGRKIGEQVFCAASQSFYELAAQLLRKAPWQRPAEVAAPHFDFVEALAFHGGRQTAPNRLDLWQFGHD